MTDLGLDTTKDARLCAEVVEERDALMIAATALLSHYTSAPHCGHDFTCTCKDRDIATLRALLARLDGRTG